VQPPPYPYGQQPYYPPPIQQSPRRRFPVVRVILFIVLSLVLIAGYFVFTAKPPPDGYMNSEDGSSLHILRFLKWVENSGQISGYWSLAEVKGNARPTYSNGTLTGTHSGSSISVTFDAGTMGISYTDTGTLEGNALSLQAQMDNGMMGSLLFVGVSMDQYNAALSGFKAAYGNRR